MQEEDIELLAVTDDGSKSEEKKIAAQHNRAVITNGSNSKRSDVEREMDLVEEARLYLAGYSQMEIAQRITSARQYSITHHTIFKDMREIRERWKKQALQDMDQAKSQELARIDALERTYWIEFEESKKPLETLEQKKVTDRWLKSKTKANSDAGYERTMVNRKREERGGSLECLKGVQWCIQQRCKIIGLDAPRTVNINWRDQAREAGLNPDEVQNDLVNQFLQAAATGQPPALGGGGYSGSLDDSAEEITGE